MIASKNLNKIGHGIIGIFFALFVGYLNFLLIRYFFVGDFNQNLQSIEISYIQMAKFWTEGGSPWQPLWYLGYPWHVFYTPLLPFLEVVLHSFFGFSFGHAYRVLTASSYILVPISLFLFIWQVSKSKTGAFVGGLFYTFVPSIISIVFTQVGADRMGPYLEPRRFAILVRWGEGPHTMALVFLPLFGLFLSRFLERDKFKDAVLASFFLGLVMLTNAIGMWAAVLMFFAFSLSEFTKKDVEVTSVIKKMFVCGILAMGLVAFWFNLPFIKTFFREGGGAFSNWSAMFPWGFILIVAGFAVVFTVVRRLTRKFVGLAFAIFWFVMLFLLVYVYYQSGESRLELVPQALRLNTEVDLASSVLAGVIVSNVFLFLGKIGGKFNLLSIAAAYVIFGVASLGILYWGQKYLLVLPAHTRALTYSHWKSIEATNEYRVAKKLKEITGDSDRRVLAPGNYSFWLNYFVDVPQLRGALYQSSTHFWPDHIYWQLANGADAGISLAWLKIANIGTLVYTTAGSGEIYKDFRVPEDKFNSILKKEFQEQGDTYFSVPLKNDSLAKAVDWRAIGKIKKPKNAIDKEPIYAYVGELEKFSDNKIFVSKLSQNHYKIKGEVKNGQGVLFQQTYDSGWHVKQGGWRKMKDSLGFLVLVPKKAGPFEIDLVYGWPISVYLGYLITILTLVYVTRKFLPFQIPGTKVLKA